MSGQAYPHIGRPAPRTSVHHLPADHAEDILVVEVVKDPVRREHENISMLEFAVGNVGVAREIFVLLAPKHLCLESQNRWQGGKLIWRVEAMRLRGGVVMYGCETEEDKTRVSKARCTK